MDNVGLLRAMENALPVAGAAIGQDELGKAQAAFIKALCPDFDTRGIPAFKGIREAYLHFTGDSEFRGEFNLHNIPPGLRSRQDITSSTFPYALQNALNMYLSREYRRFPFHENKIISEKRKAPDFRSMHSVQLGYLADLPDMDPEAEDYSSLGSGSDTESEYDINQKGVVIAVTRKHIFNDSIGVVKAMVERVCRAARRAHAKYVWNFFINNSNAPDGTAWFHADHGNLGTSALDFDSIVTAITDLANMTEPDPSGEKLGLDLATFDWSLVIPIDLWDTAVKKNQARVVDSDNTPNPVHHLFGENNERILVIPFFSDANDWGIIRGKEDVPIIEMAYLEGREEPEFVIHEDPKAGFGFMSDKYGYKCRHEYGGTLADYRGAYKQVVG